ncbi:hypothetical protein ATM97_05185 [Nocardia sp. MH4]|nr:hypothetical protein [Nocardia sp. MH4]
MSKAFPDVPIQIGAAAGEATGCFSVEHYRAAVILARAVVEATAKDKGFTKGTLADKIDAMQAAGRIRPHTKDAAHEIRYMGNDMAHGDFATTIEKDEADDVLNFMSEILEEIYQGPARVDRQRAARLAKKAPVQAGP